MRDEREVGRIAGRRVALADGVGRPGGHVDSRPYIVSIAPRANVSPPPGRGAIDACLYAGRDGSTSMPAIVAYIHAPTAPYAPWLKLFIPAS